MFTKTQSFEAVKTKLQSFKSLDMLNFAFLECQQLDMLLIASKSSYQLDKKEEKIW